MTATALVVVATVIAEDLNLGVAGATVPAPAGGSVNGNQINLSTLCNGVYLKQAIASLNTQFGGPVSQNYTVPGAAIGDMVLATLDGGLTPPQVVITGQVTAPNTVQVSFYDPLGPGVIPACNIRVLCFRLP